MAETFEQKRKLKAAAKKILTYTMVANMRPTELEELKKERAAILAEDEDAAEGMG